ncbi:MAG: glutamate racemase [Salinivirgaceae bacterium]|nr:glutamate racemase [Salinivirgaceae bacterium]
MKKQPIGIFDSGVGGLSVLLEINAFLPNEDVIYLADSKNCPYGPKSDEQIIKLSIRNCEFLIANSCKAIVVACNTATAAAIEVLRSKFNIPIIGMEPAIKPAALNTNTGKIGILATKGTFNGKLYKDTSEKYANNIDKVVQIGDGLVELVENNMHNSEEARQLIFKYISPMINNNVDQIVLGCTHYPFFKSLILDILPEHIKLIDPSLAIAVRLKSVLKKAGILSVKPQGKLIFYSSGEINTLQILVKEYFQKVESIQKITLDTN